MTISSSRLAVRSRVRAAQANASGGFTLIELVIVVLIVAILAAIAIPSYRKYMIRSHRSAAESFMMELANAQERFMVDNRGYAPDLTTLGYPASVYPGDVADNYQPGVTISAGPPPSFSITMKPIGRQVQDTQCGTLTLASDGTRSPSTSACWK